MRINRPHPKSLRRMATISIFLLLPTIFLLAVLGLGAGGIANEFDDALKKVKELEKNGNLDALPETLPEQLKADILFMDGYYPGLRVSAAMERYVKETEEMGDHIFEALIGAVFLLMVSIITRIYLRKDAR